MQRESLAAALKVFEERSAPTLWSVGDVGDLADVNLTYEEKKDALYRFVENYELTEADRTALQSAAQEVANEREPSSPRKP